jgi:hypothetical protein
MVRSELLLQEAEGFRRRDLPDSIRPGSYYLGDRNKLYLRYRNRESKRHSLGFTLEKDAGEQLGWQHRRQVVPTDFASAHLVLHNRGKLKTLALGDYQLQIGQGLILASGFQTGKGAETTNALRRYSTGLRPYTSALESNFFRGAAATWQEATVEFTAFASHLGRDGRLLQLDTALSTLETLYSTGFHRTPSEVAARNAATETVVGGHIRYTGSRLFSAGATAVHTRFSEPLLPRGRFYQQFDFSGDQNTIVGADAQGSYGRFSYFGEIARSASGGVGAVAGANGSISARVSAGVLYRNYARNFHSLYGAAFGEGGRNSNEEGLYLGLKVLPSDKFQLAFYADQFWFKWLRYRVDAPSEGVEYLARAVWQANRSLQLQAQYRYESKDRNFNDDTEFLSTVIPLLRQNLLLNLSYRPAGPFRFRTRLQGSKVTEGSQPTFGYVVLQDITYSLEKWRFTGRTAFIRTDNYDNRQYVYENNVLYAFSIPAYYGHSIRQYLLVQYELNRRNDFWLRYATTRFTDRENVSSGLQQTRGPVRSQLTLQWMYKF